jgi:cell division protein FtsI (penicillin-binding protein 3)
MFVLGRKVASNSTRNLGDTRLYILGAVLIIWCSAICLRLVYLQIFRYGSFEQRAQHQQQRTVEVSARRGVIYDRAGRELAMSVSVDSAFAVPTEIPNLAQTISLIARITKTDPRELLARCKGAKTFCWVARKADAETAARIRALNLRGIYFQKESKRFYPKGELAAQIIGYVGTDDEGLSGIEREYDDRLRGRPGEMLISVDARRKWFGSVEKQPEPGHNVVLTIDQQIQYIAERELEAAMQQNHAISGTVVVENPHTGEILALANRPTFDPNRSKEITPAKLKNHAISDVYEPGSTFKLVTISAAVDQGFARPDELIDCQRGSIVLFGHRIHDWHPWGVMPVSEVLAQSSDVGAIKIALRMGDERMYKYISAFGFGQQTGIELPGETRGMTKPLSRWSKMSIGAIAMGQEIGISAVQLAGMVSSIADDGTLLAPRIVAGEGQPQGGTQTIAFHPVYERRVVSTKTAAEVRQMMQGVVLHGTGRKAALDGYSAAGKTGTAQKFDPVAHKYSHTNFYASFAGFSPINNPAITVVVIFDSPVAPTIMQREGGWTAAPVFNRIAQQTLEYLHVPHDVELSPNRQLLLASRQVKDEEVAEGSPDHLGDPVDASEPATGVVTAGAPAPLRRRDTPPVTPAALIQPEPISVQEPSRASEQPDPTERTPTSGTVVLDVEQGGIPVPSFAGKSVRAAIELAEQSGLDLDAVGSGVAQEQSPLAGVHVPSGSRVTVKFGR